MQVSKLRKSSAKWVKVQKRDNDRKHSLVLLELGKQKRTELVRPESAKVKKCKKKSWKGWDIMFREKVGRHCTMTRKTKSGIRKKVVYRMFGINRNGNGNGNGQNRKRTKAETESKYSQLVKRKVDLVWLAESRGKKF